MKPRLTQTRLVSIIDDAFGFYRSALLGDDHAIMKWQNFQVLHEVAGLGSPEKESDRHVAVLSAGETVLNAHDQELDVEIGEVVVFFSNDCFNLVREGVTAAWSKRLASKRRPSPERLWKGPAELREFFGQPKTWQQRRSAAEALDVIRFKWVRKASDNRSPKPRRAVSPPQKDPKYLLVQDRVCPFTFHALWYNDAGELAFRKPILFKNRKRPGESHRYRIMRLIASRFSFEPDSGFHCGDDEISHEQIHKAGISPNAIRKNVSEFNKFIREQTMQSGRDKGNCETAILVASPGRKSVFRITVPLVLSADQLEDAPKICRDLGWNVK